MNQDVFFKNFELLADAPNGVQKLRELILQLAVMGKLVPQDPNDEPASVLLEKIEAEKKKLVKEKIIRADSFAQIEEDEILFKIPNSWVWIRLGQIGDWGAGSTPNRRNSDYFGGTIKWFKSGELNDGYIIDSEEKITDLALKDCSLRLNKKDDVLIAMYGATIGKIAILDTEATTNQAVCACTCFTGVYNRYLFFLLKAYRQYFTSQGAGGAQPNISRIKIVNTVVPLPPLAEQKRIVAKVNELMVLCDKLEAHREKKQELQSKLNNAALEKMLSAENQKEFEQYWQRICENFDLLYDNPENVEKLKQAILQLAVQGKLVEQNPEDEPASVLIEKIEMKKGKFVEGRRSNGSQSIFQNGNENEKKIPHGWKNLVLGNCIELISGQHLGKDEQNDAELGLPYLTGPADFGSLYPTATRWTEKPKVLSRKDDILITVKGAGVGKTNILGMDEVAIGRQLMAIRPICLDYKFVYLLILASYDKFQELSIGLTVPGISREDILNFQFGLPPLNEQKRIVEKVEQFMEVCDELEAKLRKSREDSEKLMETVVRGLLEGATTEI
jgi:type I restriction enzyme S subunit